MVATQHGFGLLLLDTGATQRKGEFVTAAHGQDGVKQAGGWKNVHSGDTKIRPQGLVDGLHDNLRMTNKVRAVLVHPRVKGGHIHVAYFLALPSHSMQGHRACSPPPPPTPKKGLTGFQRWNRQARCLPDGPTHTRNGDALGHEAEASLTFKLLLKGFTTCF